MKKSIILSLAISVILSVCSFTYATENKVKLTDINGTSYEEAINKLVDLNIISGYLDNTYRPENIVTRAEMAKLLVVANNLENKVIENKEKLVFKDMKIEHWSNGYVNTAYEYGYINGYPDKTFKPDDEVSYEEALTMTIRMLGYGEIVDKSGTWPQNYITRAKNLRLLDKVDYEETSDEATRGNIAQIVWNALDTTKSYYIAGVVEDVNKNKLDEYYIEIEGESYSYKASENKNIEIEEYKDGILFYLMKKNVEKCQIYYESGLKIDEIFGLEDDYIEEKEGNRVLFTNRGIENFKDKFAKDYKKYIFINATIDEDEKKVLSVDEVMSVSNVTSDNFEKGDRVFIDDAQKVLYIISGFEEKEL